MRIRKQECVGFTENEGKIAMWKGVDCDCSFQTGDATNVKLGEVREEECFCPEYNFITLNDKKEAEHLSLKDKFKTLNGEYSKVLRAWHKLKYINKNYV